MCFLIGVGATYTEILQGAVAAIYMLFLSQLLWDLMSRSGSSGAFCPLPPNPYLLGAVLSAGDYSLPYSLC
jgi:hypothetical protein